MKMQQNDHFSITWLEEKIPVYNCEKKRNLVVNSCLTHHQSLASKASDVQSNSLRLQKGRTFLKEVHGLKMSERERRLDRLGFSQSVWQLYFVSNSGFKALYT